MNGVASFTPTAVLWTSADAVEATGGRATRPFETTGVAIDNRAVRPGDLFVALVGPNHDGHDFVAKALTAGAAAAVVHRIPDGVGADSPLLVVGDSFAALGHLARQARNRCPGRIVAVTGSVGKTGVKEALRYVLGGQGPTAASEGNLNNHWGLPLSLARLAPDSAFGVFEVGMNHAGEITPLSQLLRPLVAVITTVEAVHAGHFPSVEAIADAKAEIFAGLDRNGAAVLPRDNPHFERLAAAARAAGCARLVGFGRHAEAQARVLDATLGPDHSDVEAEIFGRRLEYRLSIPGPHWVVNSVAVLAAVAAIGADVLDAAERLPRLEAMAGRGRRQTIDLGSGSFALIDESYNASPVSIEAALAVLGRATVGKGGRRIAVLGDMLELGVDSGRLHEGLAAAIEANRIDLVFASGPEMARLATRLPKSRLGAHAATSAALAPLVAAAVHAGDVVTVKGSAGSKMGAVVQALVARARG